MSESAAQQINRLAQFIMDEIPGEPSQSQSAVDTAIRLLTPLAKRRQAAARPEGEQ